jgi:hypothetical protein
MCVCFFGGGCHDLMNDTKGLSYLSRGPTRAASAAVVLAGLSAEGLGGYIATCDGRAVVSLLAAWCGVGKLSFHGSRLGCFRLACMASLEWHMRAR